VASAKPQPIGSAYDQIHLLRGTLTNEVATRDFTVVRATL